MSRASRSGAAVIGLWLGTGGVVATHAQDVSAYLGQPTVALRLEREGRVIDDPAMLELVETRVGEPLVMEAVRESVLHLFSLGRFEDIRVEAVAVGGGVDLVYDLAPVHPVGDLVFRGEMGVPAGRLREALIEQFGRVPSVARLPEMIQIVEQLHRDRGYMSPAVSARPEIDHRREETVLVFDVEAGARARLGDVSVAVRPAEPAGRVERRLGLVPGEPYDRLRLEARVEAYLGELRRDGYYVAGVEYAARVSPDGRAVDVSVEVVRGPRVVVRFVGDDVPLDETDPRADIQRESSVDEDLLEDVARRIVTAFNTQGYRRAAVGFERRASEGLLEVVFDVARGALFRLHQLDIVGNVEIPEDVLRSELSLTEGAPFVQAELDAAVTSLTSYYRRRGFIDATVEAGVEPLEPEADAVPGERQLVARIAIDEGPRTVVSSVRFTGNVTVPDAELRAQLTLQPGTPFYQPDVVVNRDLIVLHYLNLGYQDAAVQTRAEFVAAPDLADVVFDVFEGPKILIDHILVVGNDRISRETIQRELVLRSGDPLALDDLIESQRRLRALGVFRSVQITEIAATTRDTRDLLVSVEESPATSIGYGGGLEAGRRLVRTADGRSEERLEFAPRGFFEIGRRNLWGKNRSLDLFTRVSVRRGDGVQDASSSSGGLGFNEYRVVGTYREPRPFGWNAEFLGSAFLEQAIRSSFNFNRLGASLEVVRRLSSDVNLSGRYSLDRTRLFDERFTPGDELLIDRLFPQVRLSAFSSALIRDTRGDPLDPTGGNLFSIDSKLAGRALGSQVGFAKALLQAFTYRSLRQAGGPVLALGARLGMAVGFPRDVVREDAGNPIVDESGQPIVDRVDNLPASERFFAGGDSTVRGFALDRLGTPETIDRDGFPTGGNALLIFNAELRVPMWRDVGAVVFVDAGNVFARVSDLGLGGMRGSVGFGVRYRSPVGPIRVDLGFKLDRRQFDNGQLEPRTALHVSIGQAF